MYIYCENLEALWGFWSSYVYSQINFTFVLAQMIYVNVGRFCIHQPTGQSGTVQCVKESSRNTASYPIFVLQENTLGWHLRKSGNSYFTSPDLFSPILAVKVSRMVHYWVCIIRRWYMWADVSTLVPLSNSIAELHYDFVLLADKTNHFLWQTHQGRQYNGIVDSEGYRQHWP